MTAAVMIIGCSSDDDNNNSDEGEQIDFHFDKKEITSGKFYPIVCFLYHTEDDVSRSGFPSRMLTLRLVTQMLKVTKVSFSR